MGNALVVDRGAAIEARAQQLGALEGRIADALKRAATGFRDAGSCLTEIKESQLYLATHINFDTYCRERWDMSRAAAYRAIDASKVAEALSPIGDSVISESQARELAPLLRKDEGAAVATWKEVRAKHGENVTAAKIRQVAVRRLERIEDDERSARRDREVSNPDDPGFDRRYTRDMARHWLERIATAVHWSNLVPAAADQAVIETIRPATASKRAAELRTAIERLEAAAAALELRAAESKP